MSDFVEDGQLRLTPAGFLVEILAVEKVGETEEWDDATMTVVAFRVVGHTGIRLRSLGSVLKWKKVEIE